MPQVKGPENEGAKRGARPAKPESEKYKAMNFTFPPEIVAFIRKEAKATHRTHGQVVIDALIATHGDRLNG